MTMNPGMHWTLNFKVSHHEESLLSITFAPEPGRNFFSYMLI